MPGASGCARRAQGSLGSATTFAAGTGRRGEYGLRRVRVCEGWGGGGRKWKGLGAGALGGRSAAGSRNGAFRAEER
jgi:hypothetical protein